MSRRSLWVAVVVLATVWPSLLAWSFAARLARRTDIVAAAVEVAAAAVCHRRADRSFVTAGVQWPVCGRCAGLYLAAPLGVLVARRHRRPPPGRLRRLLGWAAVPTALTLAAEWLHAAPVTNLVRALAAAPLAAAIMAAILAEIDGSATDPQQVD